MSGAKSKSPPAKRKAAANAQLGITVTDDGSGILLIKCECGCKRERTYPFATVSAQPQTIELTVKPEGQRQGGIIDRGLSALGMRNPTPFDTGKLTGVKTRPRPGGIHGGTFGGRGGKPRGKP